jgi:hypothetical protein
MSRTLTPGDSDTYPEIAVRAEVIGRFFSPPLASSTFYDLVNKGKIVPIKGIRGFYKLNDSLRRLGLREVPKLPFEVPARTPEEIIRFAFSAIDPEVFDPPSWQLEVEAIDEAGGEAETEFAARIAQCFQIPDLGLDGGEVRHGWWF